MGSPSLLVEQAGLAQPVLDNGGIMNRQTKVVRTAQLFKLWKTERDSTCHYRPKTTRRQRNRLAASLLGMCLFTVGPVAGQQDENDYEAPSVPLEAFAARPATFNQEMIEIMLEPGEGMEYKYRLEPGGTLLFSWTADALIHYELHSQPEDAPKGFAETYDKQDYRDEAHGSYAAPFAGIHGWYWKNNTEGKVTISLTTAGFYSESLEYRSGMDVMTKQF